MANIKAVLNTGLSNIMGHAGLSTSVNIISYTFTDSDYDDVTTKTNIGSSVVSGIVFPIKNVPGSQESLLLEQGKLLTKDKVLYTGSVNISGNVLIELKTGDFYTIIPDGIQTWEVAGSTVFNKMFIRYTIPGSLF